MVDLKKAIKTLRNTTKDKVVAYGQDKDNDLILITDIGLAAGCNHYKIFELDGECYVAPTNPVLCELKETKKIRLK